MRIKERNQEKEVESKRVYTHDELQRFDNSVQKYKREIEIDGIKKIILDWPTIYFKAGVQTKDGVVTWYMRGEQKVFNINEFQNKKKQWERWKYGMEKRDEYLDKTAEDIDAEKLFQEW